MNKFYLPLSTLLFVLACVMTATRGHAGFATTVPVSAATATSIAGSFFPVSLEVGAGNLFLTEPVVVFLNERRMGLRARLQAYDHRPEQNIAISEQGYIQISGEVSFDPKTRQLLLYSPRIDELVFDTRNEVTRRLRGEVKAAWEAQVTNPVRTELPPHPFIVPFRDGIQDITYQDNNIFVQVWYP